MLHIHLKIIYIQICRYYLSRKTYAKYTYSVKGSDGKMVLSLYCQWYLCVCLYVLKYFMRMAYKLIIYIKLYLWENFILFGRQHDDRHKKCCLAGK